MLGHFGGRHHVVERRALAKQPPVEQNERNQTDEDDAGLRPAERTEQAGDRDAADDRARERRELHEAVGSAKATHARQVADPDQRRLKKEDDGMLGADRGEDRRDAERDHGREMRALDRHRRSARAEARQQRRQQEQHDRKRRVHADATGSREPAGDVRDRVRVRAPVPSARHREVAATW